MLTSKTEFITGTPPQVGFPAQEVLYFKIHVGGSAHKNCKTSHLYYYCFVFVTY